VELRSVVKHAVARGRLTAASPNSDTEDLMHRNSPIVAVGFLGSACLALAISCTPAGAMPKRVKGADPDAATPSLAQPLPQKSKEYPVGTTWVLKSVNEKPVPINEELTFMIDKNYRGSGYSGCNMWSATIYPIKNQKLLVGPIAVTKKQCEKEKTQFEILYLTAIHLGPTWDLVNGFLVLKSQAGQLSFQRSL
jgi:heat shock protein HslJ